MIDFWCAVLPLNTLILLPSYNLPEEKIAISTVARQFFQPPEYLKSFNGERGLHEAQNYAFKRKSNSKSLKKQQF
jgi:hypothetical protein